MEIPVEAKNGKSAKLPRKMQKVYSAGCGYKTAALRQFVRQTTPRPADTAKTLRIRFISYSVHIYFSTPKTQILLTYSPFFYQAAEIFSSYYTYFYVIFHKTNGFLFSHHTQFTIELNGIILYNFKNFYDTERLWFFQVLNFYFYTCPLLWRYIFLFRKSLKTSGFSL